MDIKEDWLLWFTIFLIKSPLQVVEWLITRFKKNLQLAEELHKPIVRNFKKITVYSGFKDNIWGADMQLIKDLDFYCVLLIFLVNMLGFFL